MTFEQDRAICLERYLREPPAPGPEGLRDNLYQAYLRLKTGDPEQAELGWGLLRQAPWGPCPYSGLPAVQLLTECGDRLAPDVREMLLAFLREGRGGWMAELEKGACNSFRLLAAVSLLGCGLLLGDQPSARAGEAALAWMEEHLAGYDLPDEFLSPFYTGLQLAALAEIQLLPVEARGRAARLEAFIWRGVLRHFQAGMPEPAGPYCRGYTSELAGHFQVISACLLRLLGEEAGFTLRDTLWNPAYSSRILPHGTVENMRCYALYFSAFPYHCQEEDLRSWRARTYPLRTRELAHTDASRDISIKAAVPEGAPWDYPEGDVRLCSVQEEGFSWGWADREFENGMACSSPHILYLRDGWAKTCFLKLVRAEDRYLGDLLDYPNLHLRMGASNFPDDGRKRVEEVGDALRVTYRPRAFLRGAASMKLDVIFPTHFSLPDAVRVGERRVGRWDGTERFPPEPVTVRDGDWAFTFQPLEARGFWRIVHRNQFLNLEWVQASEDFDALRWCLTIRRKRLEQRQPPAD